MKTQLLACIAMMSLCLLLFNNCSGQKAGRYTIAAHEDAQAELEAIEDAENMPAPEPEEEIIPIGPIDPADEVSIPGKEDEPTGGNIVNPEIFDQASILGQPDRQRIYLKASPDDTYTATAKNLPDGFTISVNSGSKRITILGTPTPLAMASTPYNVELTISNSTDSRTVKYQWHIYDGIAPPPNPNNIKPCGGNPTEGGTLWAWSWAGLNRQHLTTAPLTNRRSPITRMEDLSGNNNFYYTPPGDRDGHASEAGGYTWRNYYTPYPTVGLDFSDRTGVEYYGQDLLQNASMAADGEFYLAAAVMNSRTGGNGSREIFGSADRGNVLRYSQGPDRKERSAIGVLRLSIAGNGAALTPKYSYSAGPLLIEVWRDSDNIVHSRVNGVDNTINGGVLLPGVFNMTGLSGDNVSGFDDVGFEFISCKGATSAARMDQTRDYLRQKWKLY